VNIVLSGATNLTLVILFLFLWLLLFRSTIHKTRKLSVSAHFEFLDVI
jgi:hypothetical protein